MVPRRAALLLCVVATACGGGKSTPPIDSGTADGPKVDSGTADGPTDSPTDGLPGVTGLVASNGVPIPDPPLTDPCAQLGTVAKSCAPEDDCAPLTCDCDDGPWEVPFLGHQSCGLSGRCLVGVSCPAACALGMAVSDPLLLCLFNDNCKASADCADPTKPYCLLPLAGTTGHCTSRQATADCYRDSDCEGVCVASSGGTRSCQDGTSGSSCNRNDQCRPHDVTGIATCILPDGDPVGTCSDGTNGAHCTTGDQCLPGYPCVHAPGFVAVCSSRGKGGFCAVDADCAQGFCVTSAALGTCDSGEAGATCVENSDCRIPACFAQKCTGGGNGATCYQDAQCATQKCTLNVGPNDGTGQCTDGKTGSPCENTDQCGTGLHCDWATGKCSDPVGIGATCRQDGDCLTQKCGGAFMMVPGVCTDGQRGAHCSANAQCAAGLHCFPSPFGVCVAGAAGDPCLTGADCTSGMCSNPGGGATLPACSGGADLASCANDQGACVGAGCFYVCK